jgi:carbonic anhydrase
MRSIVDRIRPSVEPLLSGDRALGADGIVDAAVRANIRVAAEHLRSGSEILERLVAAGGLLVVGAEYSLETGVVDFFDGAP